MGFRKQATHYKLRFEDPELEGLEIVATSLPLGEFLDFGRDVASEQDTQRSEKMFTMFAKHLVSWNLEDENGKPVPTTYKGIISQEFGFMLEIVKAWMDAIASVPKLSQNGSNGSGIFPEQSLPMEVS